jgi:hypothetical protein
MPSITNALLAIMTVRYALFMSEPRATYMHGIAAILCKHMQRLNKESLNTLFYVAENTHKIWAAEHMYG